MVSREYSLGRKNDGEKQKVGAAPRLAFCFSTQDVLPPLGLNWQIQTDGPKGYGIRSMPTTIVRPHSYSKRGQKLQRIQRVKRRDATLQVDAGRGYFLARV